MAEMELIDDQSIPVQRIISLACRDFMAFDGLHTFDFDEGVNTIVGGNSSGKTSLITIISQALSRTFSLTWSGRWYNRNDIEESLIEMKFIAGDQEHYLRRVLQGNTTTDIHLYVGTGSYQTFYRDGGAMKYLRKLKPISTIDGFDNPRKDFYLWTNGKTVRVSPNFSRSKNVINGINRFLPLAHIDVVKLKLIDDDVMAQCRNGDMFHLSTLSSGDLKTIFIIAKLYNLLNGIQKDGASRVILVDELEIGLEKGKIKRLYDVIKSIADDFDCQFMITTRFVNGRMNPIRVNKKTIPRCYIENKTTNLQQLIGNYTANTQFSKGGNTWSFIKNLQSNYSGKITYKKGFFKWNP